MCNVFNSLINEKKKIEFHTNNRNKNIIFAYL